MDESEWLKLVDLFFEYAKTMEDVQKFIGSINGLEDPTMKDIPLLETVTNGKKLHSMSLKNYN